MNKIFLFGVMALFLSSCHTSKQAVLHAPVILNNSDSVRVETIINTIYVPTPVALDIPRQSQTSVTAVDSSHVETDLAESDAWINDDGTLGHSIINKPGKLEGEVYVPQTTTQNNKEAVREREIPVPQPYPVEIEREFTRMEQIKLAAFWYLVGAVIVSIGLLYRRPLWAVLRKIIRL
ncbi:hypothetical protein [Xylanibacter rodentium]|uniref:hypothetical protein n=1 Tax=Xylanibacter rodentium TaxID=2736289 RepID=UPI00258DA470|nr:hypothetical protein [Xylanibacter rodentium]